MLHTTVVSKLADEESPRQQEDQRARSHVYVLQQLYDQTR